jgi:aspartyl-tRNA(Asn)/glutamyl-tRNA(Gln) amidotransferase subunit C
VNVIDERTMERVEALSGLSLSPEERRHLRADLSRILDYFQKLQELPTEDVPPFTPLPGQVNAWREDEPRASVSPEEAMANAPAARDGYFFVPPVFEG